MNIKILTDSCCDLPLSFVASNSDLLEVLGMPIQIQGREIIDDLGSKGKADNLTGKEWFEQLDFYEEFFKGMTVTEVALWFNKYCDANGRPYKLAYPEKMTDADKAVVATFTEAEKEMLVDVTTSATMSLQDSHSYFIKSLLKTWAVRAEIK